MKKLILFLVMAVTLIAANGQDVKPTSNFNYLYSPSFYRWDNDTTIWIFAQGKWVKLVTNIRMKHTVDSIMTVIGSTYVSSATLGAKADTATVGAHVRNVSTAHNINLKVDKVAGKQLSTEDYSTAEKTKLAGIEAGANNYTHPANHAPSIITQDASNRFVSDTQINTWNSKQGAINGSGFVKADGTTVYYDNSSYLPSGYIRIPYWEDAYTDRLKWDGGASGLDAAAGRISLGIGNINNTSDADKPISTATQTALNGKINTTEKGDANGVATLDENKKVPLSQINDVLLGSMRFQTAWYPSTNTPTLPTPSASNKGFYWIATGDSAVYSGKLYRSKDLIVSDGSGWQKIDNNNFIVSVFGRVGAVVANTGDYNTDQVTEGSTNKYFPGFGTDHTKAAYGDHGHNYEPAISKGTGFLKWNGSGWVWDSSNYLASFTETDPTINAWAKAATKPTYTYTEVGAEQAFSKNTAFNKNFGTTTGTVLEGRTFGSAANAATTDFIQNQNASAQTANIWISGDIKTTALANSTGHLTLSTASGSSMIPFISAISESASYGLYHSTATISPNAGFTYGGYYFNVDKYDGSAVTSGDLFRVTNNNVNKFSVDYAGTISATGGNSTQWNSAYTGLNASGLINNTLTKWDQTNSKLVNSLISEDGTDVRIKKDNASFIISRANGGYGFRIYQNISEGSINYQTKLNDNATWQTYMTVGEGNTSANSHVILQPTQGSVWLGYTSDPTSGNKFAVNGNSHFGGNLVLSNPIDDEGSAINLYHTRYGITYLSGKIIGSSDNTIGDGGGRGIKFYTRLNSVVGISEALSLNANGSASFVGNATFGGSVTATGAITAPSANITNSSNSYLNIDAANSGGNESGLWFKIGGVNKWEQYTAANDANWNLYSQGNGIKLSLTPTGNLTTTGTATASNFILSSDSTLKRNIKPIEKKFDFKFWQYNLKSDSTNRDRYGVIAQEIEKDYPEFVYTDANGKKGVAYTDLLIAKVSQQDARIDQLEALLYSVIIFLSMWVLVTFIYLIHKLIKSCRHEK